jgi:catechol 2,3-dioxygenase-like lactoylglutathione lyase family enzyme
MTEQHLSPRLRHVGTVFVPVADQGRALSFYNDALGFETRSDFEYGGGQRWIEVAPPASSHRIALVPRTEGAPPLGPHTYCALEADNAESIRQALKSRGVKVSEIAQEGTQRTGLFADNVTVSNPVPPQFYLHDPDGNRFLVVEVGQ